MDQTKDALMKDVAVFQQYGFKLVNKDNVLGNEDDDYSFDPHSPDAILVTQGGVSGTPLNHGIVCMHANARSNTFIYTALNEATESSKLESLEQMGSFFYQIPDGTHVGYIPVGDKSYVPNKSSPVQSDFSDTLDKITALKLDTVNMPMHPSALGLLPFFSQENSRPQRLTEDQLIRSVVQSLGSQSGVMDMNDHQKELLNDYGFGLGHNLNKAPEKRVAAEFRPSP
jgi:hypothetical protein